jgi:hypothetical protein
MAKVGATPPPTKCPDGGGVDFRPAEMPVDPPSKTLDEPPAE